MNEDVSGVGRISLASFGYKGSRAAQCLPLPHLVFQQNWGKAILAFSSFFSQIPHQMKSEISVVYLAPHEDNRIQLMGSVQSKSWKNSFVIHLKLRRLTE
jgi:hypothetical protein